MTYRRCAQMQVQASRAYALAREAAATDASIVALDAGRTTNVQQMQRIAASFSAAARICYDMHASEDDEDRNGHT